MPRSRPARPGIALVPRCVRGWQLWSQPRTVLVYVLAVEAVAALLTMVTTVNSPAPTPTDAVRFAILAGCAALHIDCSRGVDRTRNLTSAAAPSLDTKSVWSFAAVLVLPLSLASAMVVLTHLWAWMRVWRGRRPLYRWVFSGATVLIATPVARAVLLAGPGPHPGLPTVYSPATVAALLGVIAGAGALRWLVNYTLVVGAIVVSTPGIRGAQLLHNIDERALEAGALGLGLAAAALVVWYPPALAGVVIGLLAMHRGVLLPQLRRQASTDAKTGMHAADWWHHLAAAVLERATLGGQPVGLLMLDVDHFKQINDQQGHLAGDRVLRAVAHAITSEIRASDIAGRFGGDELAILLPDISLSELDVVANRLCGRVHTLIVDIPTDTGPATVSGLTVSIGAAHYPATAGTNLDALLLAADTALYAAKQAGRDQVQFTPQ